MTTTRETKLASELSGIGSRTSVNAALIARTFFGFIERRPSLI